MKMFTFFLFQKVSVVLAKDEKIVGIVHTHQREHTPEHQKDFSTQTRDFDLLVVGEKFHKQIFVLPRTRLNFVQLFQKKKGKL